MAWSRYRPNDLDDYLDSLDYLGDISSSDEDKVFDINTNDIGFKTSLTDINNFSDNINIKDQV